LCFANSALVSEGANKEAEQKRVQKEMANIRAKFASNTALNGYQKKKYVWKLVYMFMLGYDIDFGHMEVCPHGDRVLQNHLLIVFVPNSAST
jgi:hypothetical protein